MVINMLAEILNNSSAMHGLASNGDGTSGSELWKFTCVGTWLLKNLM